MKQATLGRLVARGVLWSYAAHAGGRLTVFVGLAVLAHLLGPADFGLFGMAMAAVSLLELVRDAGLRTALIYLGEDADGDAIWDTGLTLALAVGLGLTLVLLGLVPLASLFYGNAVVGELLQVLGIYFLVASLGTVPDAMLRQRLSFGRRFWPETGGPLVRYGLAIVLALQGWGTWSLVYGQLAGVAASVLLSGALCGRLPRFGFDRALARRLLAYGWKMGTVQIMAGIVLNVDYLLIGRFLGEEQLGIYTIAFKLSDATMVAVANVMATVLLPAYVKLARDQLALRAAFERAFHFLALLLIPAAAGLALLAPLVVPLAFGDQWVGAIPVVPWLALSALFQGMLFSVGPAFLAVGRPGLLAAAEACWAAMMVLAVYLCAQHSILAVAVAHAVVTAVYAIIQLALLNRVLPLDGPLLARTVLPAVVASGLMVVIVGGLLLVLSSWPVMIVAASSLLAGGGSYLLAVWLFDSRLASEVRTLAGLQASRA